MSEGEIRRGIVRDVRDVSRGLMGKNRRGGVKKVWWTDEEGFFAGTQAVGKATAKRATGSLAASKRKADDVYDFPEDDADDDKFSIVVKWVNRGQTTSEWTFSMSVRHASPRRRRTRKP